MNYRLNFIFLFLIIVGLCGCDGSQNKQRVLINIDSLIFIKDTVIFPEDTVILLKDIPLLNLLMQVDLQKYVGLTVGQLLTDKVIGRYKHFWWEDEPPCVLNSLNLTYSRGLYLKIYFKELRYSPRFTEKCQWDFDLLKKKKIGDLVIVKDEFLKEVVNKYTRKK